MREFNSAEARTLLSGTRFIDHPREQRCPACDSASVRTYVYRSRAGTRANLITYSWCASCRRFKGWTGPDLGDLEFSDPLAEIPAETRKAAMTNLGKLLTLLDDLWEAGHLPQDFGKPSAR